MVWFKVDDGFHSHPKVKRIPRAGGLRALAAGTWTLCGTWSADNELDGWVPDYMIDECGGTVEGAEALVSVKLWRRKKGGYQFVNWSEFQPTRADNDAARESERVRKAAYRERQKSQEFGGKSAIVPTGQSRVPNTPIRSDPSRPDDDNYSSRDTSREVIHSVDEPVSNPLFEKIIAAASAGGIDLHPLVVPDVIEFIDQRRGPRAKPIQAPERYYPGVVRDEWPVVSQFIHERNLAS